MHPAIRRYKLLTASENNYENYDTRVLCFVDRVSLYNLVNKANLVHNFS